MAHEERAHAKLSASGSKRWLSCPPSAELEGYFEETTSDFAEEGTLAHELGENRLRYILGWISPTDWASNYDKLANLSTLARHWTADMEDYVKAYADYVVEAYHSAVARCPDAEILIEQRLDFSEWVPDGFGTGDTLIVADNVLDVIDLKYGKGVKVDAENNPQMRLYGLGALAMFDALYDIDTVRMTIFQPRLDHISTEEISVKELKAWAENYVKPRAQLAHDGEGEFCAGEQCLFCKAKSSCQHRANHYLQLYQSFGQTPAGLLNPEQIAEILGFADDMIKWAKGVNDFALDAAEQHGIKFPGWKLVEGRSNRVITDKDAAADTLNLEGYENEKIFKPRELKGITDLEKLVGKKNLDTFIGAYIEKPQGKPTLVPESDKRPEINSTASAIKDFED